MATRHALDQSSGDQSIISTSSSVYEDVITSFRLFDILSKEGETEPASTLRRMLSHKTAVETDLPFAQRMAKAQQEFGLMDFTWLNAGACGALYQEAGTINALKIANNNSMSQQLWNDYDQHTGILEAFALYPSLNIDIRIPRVHGFIKSDDKWWKINGNRFPKNVDPQNVLVTERILPVHRVFRRCLIKQYVAPEKQDALLKQVEDTHCLVRPYLGKRRENPRPIRTFVNLRNFCLYMDMLDELDIDLSSTATTMGQTYAVMHWQAKCNAQDVEFAFGSAPISRGDGVVVRRLSQEQIRQLDGPTSTQPHTKKLNFEHRSIHLWLLDFNQVRDISMDQEGVDMAVSAFFINDPYCPRPGQKLWATFEDAYLKTSNRLLRLQEADAGETIAWKHLPQAFVDGVIREQATRDMAVQSQVL